MTESHNIEYKESWRDEYLRQVCGLANAQGGSLFIGIDDKGEVIGVNNAKKLQEDIPNKINDTLSILPDVYLHKIANKEYLEIVIPANATPVSYRNKFYYRSGTVTIELTGSSLHTFLLDKLGGKWDSMPVNNVVIDDLDKESFDIFKRESLRSGRLNRQDFPESREELLDKLNLITEDGRLTRAAVLLFHRTPEKWIHGAYCKVALFANEVDILYHDEVHGSLMMQADRMIELIYTKYLAAKVTYDGKIRIEKYPYSKDALREGYYNALMHNFYADCVPIQIRVNPTDMWISNSLAFNSPWTPEKLLACHSSRPSNNLIANAFHIAGFVESWGRGIQNMIRDSIAYGCPAPTYGDQPQTVRLVLKAHPEVIDLQPNSSINFGKEKSTAENDRSGLQGDSLSNLHPLYTQLTPTLHPLYTRIKENPQITHMQLSEMLAIHPETVRRRINQLKELGLIRREGSDKTGYWVVIDLKEN